MTLRKAGELAALTLVVTGFGFVGGVWGAAYGYWLSDGNITWMWITAIAAGIGGIVGALLSMGEDEP